MSRAAGRLAALILGVGVRAMAGWVVDGTRDTPAGGDDLGDDLGNHTATQDVDMAGFAIKGGTASNSYVIIKGTSGTGAQTSPAVQLKTGIDGADARVTLLNNGRVGVGTTAPDTTVDIRGDLSALGQAKLYQGTWGDPASGILAAAKVNAATTANIPFVGLAAGASGAAQVNKNTYAGYFYNVSTVSGTGVHYGLYVVGDNNYLSGKVGVGTTPTVKLHVNGAIASGYTAPFQTVGPTDNLDVSGKNSIFVFAHDGPITIGGLAGGVAGQVLRIVRIAGSVYGVTLEHVEAEATQKIYLSSGADETLSTFGGWTLAYDGGGWTEVNDSNDSIIQTAPVQLASAATVTIIEAGMNNRLYLEMTNNVVLEVAGVDTNQAAGWVLDVKMNSYSLTFGASITNLTNSDNFGRTNSYQSIVGNRPIFEAVTEVW